MNKDVLNTRTKPFPTDRLRYESTPSYKTDDAYDFETNDVYLVEDEDSSLIEPSTLEDLNYVDSYYDDKELDTITGIDIWGNDE